MKTYLGLLVQVLLAVLLFGTWVCATAAPLPVVMTIFFVDKPTEYKPYFVEPHPTLDACLIAAEKKNKSEADFLKTLGDGAEFVCQPVVRVTV